MLISSVGALGAALLVVGRPQPAGAAHAELVFSAVALAPLFARVVVAWAPGKLSRALSSFLPVPVILAVYGALNPLADLLHPALADAALAAADLRLFGVHPSVWVASRLPPWLGDLLMALYTSYGFMLLGVGALLYVRRDDEAFERYGFALMLNFFVTYALYLAVPAMGPRFYLASSFHGPVAGHYLGPLGDALYKQSPFLRDCFPSGHFSCTLVALVFAWREGRRLFWTMLPFAAGLVAATICCRFHYGVDLLAAPLVTLFSLTATDLVLRRPSEETALKALPPAA